MAKQLNPQSRRPDMIKEMLRKVKRSISESMRRNKTLDEKYQKELADYEALYGKYEED